jgi:uncharacterized membrane protein YvbJ
MMPYCPKCGAEVKEDAIFCSKCGSPLKIEQAPTFREQRKSEKGEKYEKGEKREKREKHEGPEHTFIGSLIGGLVLIIIGFMLYLQITGRVVLEYGWPLILVLVGTIVIVGAVYTASTASKRQPKV